ncbi:MAG TPA: AtpZ/AtpI family protein, partial [Acidimicrobiales bacterium]|nr:AtpZ/AtpI family protein [Acidimicrobiales bacterium]
PGVMQFAGLGLMNAMCWAAGLAGGWFADHVLGTSPWLMLLGLLLGVTLGVFASRAELRRFF